MAKVNLGKGERFTFPAVRKLGAGVSLLSFLVICVSGFRSQGLAETAVISIVLKSMVVILAINVVIRVLIKVLEIYEESESGQA